MIYLLYGQPASGKTTLGKLLATHLNTPFVIDGDEFREMFTNKNYGREGREENIRNANAVATYLNKKAQANDWACVYLRDGEHSIKGLRISEETDVIMSLVNPYDHLRQELKDNNKNQIIEILLESDRDLRRDFHVEDFEVGKPAFRINTDRPVEDIWRLLKKLLQIK